MNLRPSTTIDAATRYVLECGVNFHKPVHFLDALTLRKLHLPGFFKSRKRKEKRLALPECRHL